jgi:hypothetical protein
MMMMNVMMMNVMVPGTAITLNTDDGDENNDGD